MLEDTIAAIATPIGEGGLAVIRLSGSAAFQIADQCFVSAATPPKALGTVPTHTLHFGRIIQNGRVIDEVMTAVMRAPRTFTREDVVEISCHGGVLPAKLILDSLLAAGARLAQPGEFTRRAFLNGRIDLAQAEAVADIIHSRTELSLQAATEQLAGKLSQKINSLRDQLMNVLAHVEAHIDFPDEDIAPDTREQMIGRLRGGLSFVSQLIQNAAEGQVLRQGVRAAIVGCPNAGKSSLLNQLLGRDRAIVSPIPGTTRDTIEETANIRGLPVIFIDTAGLRDARDTIEQEGIRRSHQSLQSAEIVIHVLDGVSEKGTGNLPEIQAGRRIVVRNKIDLLPSPRPPAPESALDVSCLTGEGVEDLKDRIRDTVWSGRIKADMAEAMINSRHRDALSRASHSLEQSLSALHQNLPLEMAAMDLRIATNSIGEIVGKTTTEDLLDRIFSQFCIGK
jgi:tRNA modification GTPase